MRLSRRGWNNVLIFSTLIMIVLFNTSHKLMMDNTDETGPVSVLAEGAEILRIDYGSHQLQRIGRTYRIEPSITVMPERLTQIVTAWSDLKGVVMASASLERPYIVTVWLAGEPMGRVVKILPQGQQSLIQLEDRLLLSDAEVSDLIPQELL